MEFRARFKIPLRVSCRRVILERNRMTPLPPAEALSPAEGEESRLRSSPRPVKERIEGEGPLTARGVRVSRSAPLIICLSRLVAGEAAPKERVRVLSRAIQDSAPHF